MWNSPSRDSPARADSWKMDTGASMFCHNNWCAIQITHQWEIKSQRSPGTLTRACYFALQSRHNECDGVSNDRRLDCLLNSLFRFRSKKTSKFRVTGLCARNSSVTDEIPTQRCSDTENVSIWWRHHRLTSEHMETHGCVLSTVAKAPGHQYS